jgi:hypothetical protein
LDAQNAGNGISGFQIPIIFWWSMPQTPLFMLGKSVTHVAFCHCYHPLIYYFTERSLFKNDPYGKILKKGSDLDRLLNELRYLKTITHL